MRSGPGPAPRPWHRPALTCLGLVLALVGALSLSAKATGTPSGPPASAPALLGAGSRGDPGTRVARLETAIGRTLDIGHSFVPWGRELGGAPAVHLAAGRTPMISFGRAASPRAVAAGRHDRYLKSLAGSVAALGRPALLRYAWGMDGAGPSAARSGPAYVAAWRHVHDLFAAEGVRAFWVWSPNADAFAGARGGVDRYWPGDDYVDWVGADGFNRSGCNGGSAWRDFGAIFKAFHVWGSVRAKPLMISGTGSVEDLADAGRKRAWYLGAARALAGSMPRVRAVVLLDQGGRCDWRPDTSAPSMQGFVGFARDPFFGGPAPALPAPPTTAAPTTGATTTTRAPTTTTRAPTTTTRAPATTRPAGPAPSRCVAAGGVPIGTGDDAQRVVDAHGPGTTYLVKAGTHPRNFSVRPKTGDTFCGEPGAVLDGGRSLRAAFSGRAANVTLDSLTVQRYATGRQGGAIHPDRAASGWVVRNVSAVRNYWAGLMAADGMRILGGHYNDNDQLGIGNNAASSIVLDGLDGDPATLDGPELARNHSLHESCDWESGGIKWAIGRITIRNAHVHDNDCRGLWGDINARDALIEHNLIEGNRHEGIFYEISQDAVIRSNQVYGNGHGGRGWYWAGGITIASSFNVEVYGNRLSGNYNGITGTQQTRTDSTPPAHVLDDLNVHDNVICATGAGRQATGVVADNGTNLGARDIDFTGNSIQAGACQTA